MEGYINLCLEGTAYLAAYRFGDDGVLLEVFSRALKGVAIESTFDTVYSWLAQDWQQRDDVLTPFNDRRWGHVRAVWTFDLDRDILRLDKNDKKLWVSLTLMRQRSITTEDFELWNRPPLILAKYASEYVDPALCWKMRRDEMEQQHLQRRLPRIVTLDFTVQEATLLRQGSGEFLVWIESLPEWGFASEHIVRVNGTPIVICQHTPHAVKLVRDDFVNQAVPMPGLTDKRSHLYLILSVRELILYEINSELERHTEPKLLFNGTDPPSDEAIELLIQATQPSRTTTPLHKFPVEVQDAVLDKVSAGPIERARVACLLDAGSAFAWRCDNRNIEREVALRTRTPWTPVESHIWFGGYHSGIAYK